MSKPSSAAAAISVRGKAQLSAQGTDDLVLNTGDFDVAPNASDLLVALLYSWVDPSEGSPPLAPSGWLQRAQAGLAGAQYVTAYTRPASGFAGANFQALPGEGPPASAQIIHAYSVRDITAYDVSAASVPPGVPGTSLAVTSVTTTGSADLLLGFWIGTATTGSPVAAVPVSMTGALTTAASLAGAPHSARSGYELLVASGTTGTRTGTISGGSAPILIGGLLVAVK